MRLLIVACTLGALLMPMPAHSANDAYAAEPVAADVDALFSRWSKPDAPGCAAAVYRDGKIAFQRGYGAASLEFGVPIHVDTVFDIGSTSKQFTAASILLLAQDGKLSLDDDIRKFLPELPVYDAPITVRHLLNHTSGLRDFVTLLTATDVEYDDVSTPAQALAILVRQRHLNYPPGTEYLYSNSGYFLAAEIVERVSGATLREFARRRIFEPLGMTHTRYGNDHTEVVTHRATGYSPAENGTYRVSRPNWEQIGDGGVQTTVGDLLRWDSNFYEPTVGGPDFARTMQLRGSLSDGTRTSYALGLMIGQRNGVEMIHHGGSWGGYRAEIARFPSKRLSVAVLCNAANADASELALRVADLWLANASMADEARSVAPKPRASKVKPVGEKQLRAMVGAYRSPKSGAMRFISMERGELQIEAFGGLYPLRATGNNTFALVDGPVTATYRYLPGSAAAPSRLVQSFNGRETELVAITLARPTVQELQAYAGEYRCDELGIVYRIDANATTLQRRNTKGGLEVFRTLDRDVFNYGNFSYRFQRDAAGTISGFALDIGRVRDLRCERAHESN
jgi:CubicO group peptidase (beta-lactamase class C family)